MNKKYLYLISAVAVCLGGISLPSSADTTANYNKMVTQRLVSHVPNDLIKNISSFNRLNGIKIVETKPHLKESNKRIRLSDSQLVSILREAGFEGKALRMAWAIAVQESTSRPFAFNKSSNCYGLFQINMSGSMGADRRTKFNLDSNNDLFNPLTNAKVAYHMSSKGSDWSAWSTENSAKRLASNISW